MTEREEQVANLVAAGFCTIEIAVELGISPRTVKEYKRRAARRLGYKGKRLDVFLVCTVYGTVLSQSRLKRFEPRMRRTADLVARGLTNREIAASIGISPDSVRNQLREIYDRAGVWNRRELARFVLSDEEDVADKALDIAAPGWNLFQSRTMSRNHPHDQAEQGQHGHVINQR